MRVDLAWMLCVDVWTLLRGGEVEAGSSLVGGMLLVVVGNVCEVLWQRHAIVFNLPSPAKSNPLCCQLPHHDIAVNLKVVPL